MRDRARRPLDTQSLAAFDGFRLQCPDRPLRLVVAESLFLDLEQHGAPLVLYYQRPAGLHFFDRCGNHVVEENGGMEPDNEYTQELLRIFSGNLANWLKSRQRVEETADPAPGGLAEQWHDTWLTLHNANTDRLKLLFKYASEHGVDETELSQAAGITPDELRRIRESIN
jgi:hypothetical protein